VSNTLC